MDRGRPIRAGAESKTEATASHQAARKIGPPVSSLRIPVFSADALPSGSEGIPEKD